MLMFNVLRPFQCFILGSYLNTSYVNVQQGTHTHPIRQLTNLNTSYVNVQHMYTNVEGWYSKFKYILC